MTRLNQSVRILLCLCLISICAATDSWEVHDNGVGPVKIGITLAKLNSIFHGKLTLPADKDSQSCFYATSADHPHINFMIQDSTLVRIDVDGPGVATKDGIQVGDTEGRVMKAYGGKLKVEPHENSGPEGHYLTTRSSDGLNGIRFETNEGKVEMFYVGTYDAIHVEEGCQ